MNNLSTDAFLNVALCCFSNQMQKFANFNKNELKHIWCTISKTIITNITLLKTYIDNDNVSSQNGIFGSKDLKLNLGYINTYWILSEIVDIVLN